MITSQLPFRSIYRWCAFAAAVLVVGLILEWLAGIPILSRATAGAAQHGFAGNAVNIVIILLIIILLVSALMAWNADIMRKATEESERFFSLGGDLFCVAGTDGNFRRVNQAYTNTLGWSTEEMQGRPFLDFVHPEDHAATVQATADLAIGQVVHHFENRYRCKDGSWRWLSWHAKSIPSDGVIYASARDVTMLKEMQAALVEREEDLAVTLRSLGDAVLTTDAEARVVRLNPAGVHLTGWTEDDAHGRPVEEVFRIINEKTRRPALVPTHDVLRTGEVRGLANHTVLLARNGLEWAISDSAAPLRGHDGAIRGTVMVFREVGAEREAARALERTAEELEARVAERTENLVAAQALLAEGEERYRLLVEGASEAFYKLVVSQARPRVTRIEFMSGRILDITGFTPQNFMDDAGLWARRVHPDDLARVEATTRKVLDGGGPAVRRYRLRDAKSRTHWLEDDISPVVDAEGNITGFTGVVRDITTHRLLEEQLRQSQKMESVGRLAGGIAHDFNNLLTVIISTLDLGAESLPRGSELRDDLEGARHAAEGAARLTRQLLAFSRQQILQPQYLDLITLISDTLGLLRRLIGEDIAITFDHLIDEAPVRVDPGQIEQVLVNLAVNSRDAMPDGGTLAVTIDETVLDEEFLEGHPTAEPGPHIVLTVSDTGAGMDEETRHRIFEPFFTTKGPGKGTGLGLSTVYGIIRQSGGSIWLYSEPGMGTVFKIYLPTSRAPTGHQHQPARIAEPTSAGTEVILVVEDESAVRRLAVRILSAEGYQVIEASNGEEARQILRERGDTVQLLFTDQIMPGIAGHELVKEALVGWPHLKVLFTSGYFDDSGRHSGDLPRDESPVLGKPYTRADLLRLIRRVLDG